MTAAAESVTSPAWQRETRMGVVQPIRRIDFEPGHVDDHDSHLAREWLLTNGLGGYSAGTISGVTTRRYHGLLIAALPAPLARSMMLTHLSEQLRFPDGSVVRIGGTERVAGDLSLAGSEHLRCFRLEGGLPVWEYQFGDMVLEKQILMVHEQNTVHITYRLIEGEGPVRLKIAPAVHFRSHDAAVSTPLDSEYSVRAIGDRYEVGCPRSEWPPLRFKLLGARSALTLESRILNEWLYRIEQSRGYESTGDLWSPGYFRVDLTPDNSATLVASTESWDAIEALQPESALAAEHARRERLLVQADPPAQLGLGAELVLAADQFLITPAGRVADAARAHAAGDQVRTVIAGYHWFTDWGRDTMISLEGLTITTGRLSEAGYILRTFAHYVRDGLIPNMFPEGEEQGRYHTADASVWFFHALDRYLEATGDHETLNLILPKLKEIVQCHLRGTRFGIGIDPADGLLKQGDPDLPLTWMDAKVADWVVTPRRGKTVETNALWYNALRLMEIWLAERGEAELAEQLGQHADLARESFNRRFWNASAGYLYDLIDGERGDDSACRPNQVLAISPRFPILDQSRWEQVLEVVEERLLTPFGLRTLAPGHEGYQPHYYGDLTARDAAYHQGTVWPWLIGPFIDAWLKTYPREAHEARKFLCGMEAHLSEACVGTISEIFDADAPFSPRGCAAQAWSIAEVLRCWVKTADGQ